jgi:GAF domain-containing protein
MVGFERELAECVTPEDVAWCTLNHARLIANASLGNVQLVDWSLGYLEIVASVGFGPEFLHCFRRVSKLDHSACGRAMLRHQPVLIEDVRRDYSFAPYHGIAERSGFRSVQSVPLVSSRGALYGIVSTHDINVGRPTDRQLATLQDIATAAANRIVRLQIGSGSVVASRPEISESLDTNKARPHDIPPSTQARYERDHR